MNRRIIFSLVSLALIAGTVVADFAYGDAPGKSTAKRFLVYVGTYTRGESEGIYRYSLDSATGRLSYLGVTSGVVNPSFLAIHPNRRFLYAVGESSNFGGQKSGAVNAFSISPKDGQLTPLNQQPSGGPGPCHLVVDRSGKNVLVANYGGGSVSAIPIGDDGRLGKPSAFIQHEGSSVNPRRQQGPHAHSINLDAANRFAFVADLGLDKILVYRFDADKGTLVPNRPPFASVKAGSGPRHFAFHTSGQFAYVINELASTVTAFAYHADRGVLESIQSVSTLPEGFSETNSTAEVQVHPSGKFLYGSNRGHDSIAVYTIDPNSGVPQFVAARSTRGKTPRNFGIDPTGNWLLAANQGSDNVVVFRIDRQTGDLSPTENEVKVSMPVCVKMMPAP